MYEEVLWYDLIPITENVNLCYDIAKGLDGNKLGSWLSAWTLMSDPFSIWLDDDRQVVQSFAISFFSSLGEETKQLVSWGC